MRLLFYLLPLVLEAQYGQAPYSPQKFASPLVIVQEDCWRPQTADFGAVIFHDYMTAYYLDGDTFDFPIKKSWKASGGEKIWNIKLNFLDDKILTVNDGIYRSVIYPDTLIFGRYIKNGDKGKRYRLSLFADDIYLVYEIKTRFYLYEGSYRPFESYDYLGIYRGWPDYYMVNNSYRTNFDNALEQIEKYRCKDLDAGRRKAGDK